MTFIRSLYQMGIYDGRGTGLQISLEELTDKVGHDKVKEILAEIDDKGTYVFPKLTNLNMKELIDSLDDMSMEEIEEDTGLTNQQLEDIYHQEKVLKYKDVMKLLDLCDIDPITYLM